MTMALERTFQLNGYCLAAKEWHADGQFKVIALHGWLDNAASFDVLAPLLPDCHIIALDLPGHGRSDHKSAQANYNIWDDLLDVLALADALGWETFQLFGHSRGAIIAMLLGATCPERVASLLLLDGIWPIAVEAEEAASQLSRFIQENRQLKQKKLPDYATPGDAVLARSRNARISEQAAALIVERGLHAQGERYSWTFDPRLTTASAFKLTREHIQSFVTALSVPVLLLLAEEGMGGYSQLLDELSAISSLDYQLLPGSHHFHMEEQAAAIAALVAAFLAGVNQG